MFPLKKKRREERNTSSLFAPNFLFLWFYDKKELNYIYKQHRLKKLMLTLYYLLSATEYISQKEGIIANCCYY